MNYNFFNDAIANLSQWSLSLLPFSVGLLLLIGLGFLAHNVFTAGKKGWGWVAAMLFAGVLAFMLKIAVSVFREMAGGASGSDWDG